LPRLKGELTVQGASLNVPGLQRPVLYNINCAIEPGATLGVIGPSGAGKSTLARAKHGVACMD
jgi:ABC-type protease/lipase transport system fused ATPase/permease subunit